MRCIIVDDEEIAIKVIESHLQNLGGVDVIGTFNSGKEAFTALQQLNVDLVFLDIEMPGISGLQLIKTLKHPPMVIITTAYRDYAIDGFELDVIDYLLKPIAFERLAISVSKAIQRQNSSNTYSNFSADDDSNNFIYVISEREHVKINLSDILFIESLKNHVRIFTHKGPIITLVSIGKMMERLPTDKFIRIHKTCIVSIQSIDRYTQSSITIGERSLTIGRMYKNSVMARLDGYLI